MTEKTAQAQLEALRSLIADAKSVPMSASCMVNRAEALAAVDAALASLPQELEQANQVLESSHREVRRGRDEGDKIRLEAEEWASKTASQTEVVARANQMAEEIRSQAQADADALRNEADGYVDTRFAEFEASLAKTAAQVRTMRSRLAQRAPEPTDQPPAL